jgi:CRISPR type III-A-associated protein Csm2
MAEDTPQSELQEITASQEAPKVEEAAAPAAVETAPPAVEAPKPERAKPEAPAKGPGREKPAGEPRERPEKERGGGGGVRGDRDKGRDRGDRDRGDRDRGRDRGGRPDRGRPEMYSDIDIDKLIADSLYLDNQAHAVVTRMRDMDSGTKSQLRRFYNAVRRAYRAPESDRQHQFVMLRARLAYTIARHSLRSLDSLERLLLQVTRKNDPKGYERFRDLFEAIVAYNE